MKPTFQRNVLPCSSFYAFWRLENGISTECEGWHFGDFRIRFLLSRNTKGLRVPSFLWPHFLNFAVLKMRILLGRDTHSFLWAFDGLNFYRSRFVKTTVQRYRDLCAHFRYFGGLKTPFLPSCVTHGSRDWSFLWALVSCPLLSRLVSSLVSSTLV